MCVKGTRAASGRDPNSRLHRRCWDAFSILIVGGETGQRGAKEQFRLSTRNSMPSLAVHRPFWHRTNSWAANSIIPEYPLPLTIDECKIPFSTGVSHENHLSHSVYGMR